MGWRMGAVAGTAVVGALAAAATAHGAPGPVDVEELARADGGLQVGAHVSPTGEQYVVYRGGGGSDRALRVRVRAPGEGFGPVEELSRTANAEMPAIAFAPDGAAYAIWGVATTGARAQASIRPAGGRFGAIVDAGDCGRFVDVAYTVTGRLALACSVSRSGSQPDSAATGLRDGIGQIRPSSYFFPDVFDPFIRPQVSAGADGTVAFAVAMLATTTSPPPSNETTTVRVGVRRPDGSSVNPLLVAQATEPRWLYHGGTKVLGDGTVLTVVGGSDGAQVHRLAPGGTAFALERRLPGTEALAAGTDASGALHLAVFEEIAPMVSRDSVVVRGADGTYSDPIQVPTGTGWVTDLLAAPDGTEHAVIESATGMSVATRPPGAAAFDAPIPLAGADVNDVSAALVGDRDLLVAWTTSGGADGRVLVGGIDGGTPPRLAGVRAPATLVAGEPGAFAATASDAMGMRSVTWSFGDGASSAGGAAEHAYAAPGTYTATVTAVDRAGNVAQEARTVRVVLPAGEGGRGGGGGGGGAVPVDRTAPKLRVTAPKRIAFSALAKKGLRLKVRSDERATVTATVVARARRATIARVGDLTLAERTVRRIAANRARTLALKPARRLLGRRRALRLAVRIMATDAAGNRATVSRSLRVLRR
ncbi:PKD domain-containing protein [Conexibacter arvalis]|uniref:PKD domain-containing protein n=1 Tax=Conexibacter arvalis TaxID=912552 RepID=A0A840IJQ5_9ACTN|nr:PKD domain-containing protein [Conexibacter arvalis]MBB4664158.1 hypothetical protein [Conexibacter arvalis]